MKRSFRAATVFTGAAAAAAVFAPAAGAAPLAPGTTAKITPELKGNCSQGAFTDSVHLYYEKSEHHSRAACFDVVGSVIPIKANKWASYCGGAWSGYFYINHQAARFTAGQVYHNLHGQVISSVFISKLNTAKLNSLCSPSRN